MPKREKPSLKTILAIIEEHGSMQTEQLEQLVDLSKTAIYKACKVAVEEGYLVQRKVKETQGVGRKRCTFARTKKPYQSPAVSDKALQKRLYRQRMKELRKQLNAAVTPFRHWQDVLLFGACAIPAEPQIKAGRVYKQDMTVREDELEAA
jgi:predicted transcriptional regulator